MPTAQPKDSCEASEADYSAVALAAMKGLKMDSIHDKGTKINFVRKEHFKTDSLNVELLKLDHVTDTMEYSGSTKAEGKTVNNVCKLSLLNESNFFGSLCYGIPKPERTVASHSPVFYTHHAQQHCGDGFQSPVGYTTSPVYGYISDHRSVESILKSAVENFPGTPSILRRRKTEKPIQDEDSNLKISILNSDSFHTPLGKCTAESPHSFKTATFLSLGPPDNECLSGALGSFDVSPPYRQRSKRMAILKTIEKKHLDFSSEGVDNFDNPDTMKKPAFWYNERTNSCTDVSSEQEHMIGLETLAKDFTHNQVKSDLILQNQVLFHFPFNWICTCSISYEKMSSVPLNYQIYLDFTTCLCM
ncbi:hypothetical protein HU200_024294 [Digitaria exilis]|uniref:Uncharacterized protein n=1 Tax=Digitaria exilis TaxID=1010633 RepID=A0A835CBF1_9POAL|nr:hypothetical protein HU200_024294 [Digitaria exilis]